MTGLPRVVLDDGSERFVVPAGREAAVGRGIALVLLEMRRNGRPWDPLLDEFGRVLRARGLRAEAPAEGASRVDASVYGSEGDSATTRRTWSSGEVAQLHGISDSAVRLAARSGRLRGHKLDAGRGPWLFDEDDARRFQPATRTRREANA